MKKIFVSLLVIVLLFICPAASADRDAAAVGIKTNGLSYELVDTGIEYWSPANGINMVFAYVEIKNTDNVPIYLDDCTMDFEDDSGHLLGCASWVSNCPDVINPGETGYFYISGVNGGYLDDSIDLSNGLNLYAQFALKPSKKTIIPYIITDTSLKFVDLFGTSYPVITGRIQNNTDKDESLLYINIILRGQNGKVIWASGTNIMNLYAGARIGFSCDEMLVAPNVTEENIGSFEVIAEPSYYQ